MTGPAQPTHLSRPAGEGLSPGVDPGVGARGAQAEGPLLALDCAAGRCAAWIVHHDHPLAACETATHRGAAHLAAMASEALSACHLHPRQLSLIAVIVGPGSFTGIRAALALAHGLALAADIPLAGITIAEAIAEDLPTLHPRTLWVATDSRRGRVFLDRAGHLSAVALDALPSPEGPIAIAGDQAVPVAASLAARGADIMLTAARQPTPGAIGRAARRRLAGELPARAPMPLYVDPPRHAPPPGSAPRRCHDRRRARPCWRPCRHPRRRLSPA